MVVAFLRGNSESRAQQQTQQTAYVQDPAQTIAMHHHHLQLQANMAAASSSGGANRLGSLSNGNHATKRPFQELPRLHVPSHALAQQAQPMLKTGSVIMPSSLGLVSGGNSPPPAAPPAAPRFQFFTNTVGGWFGRNNAPAKALPSFHEILARTNQLQIVGTNNQQDEHGGEPNLEGEQQDPLQEQQEPHMMPAAADIDMNSQQQQQYDEQTQQMQQEQQQEQQMHQGQQMQMHMQQQAQQQQQLQMQMQQHLQMQINQQQQQQQQQMQLHMQQQQQQQTFAMQFPPSAAPPSYTAFAPQTISLQSNDLFQVQRPSLSVLSNYNNSMTSNNNGAIEAPSPMSLASPAASQTSVDASKRRERWTEDEHARFMEGLNRYGRKWKKIQTFVQTKTAVQVRTHAYGYFAKLLRNMPEDDGVWELAEEMSSLPGAVLKGPGNGKRRNEPKTDEQGMDVLRRFVFSKKKSDDKKAASESGDNSSSAMETTTADGDNSTNQTTQSHETPYVNWSIVVEDSAEASAMLELKRQRIN